MRTHKKSADNKNIRTATERKEEMVQRGWAYGKAVLTKCSEASRGKRRSVQAALAAAALLPAALSMSTLSGCAWLQWASNEAPPIEATASSSQKAASKPANDPAQDRAATQGGAAEKARLEEASVHDAPSDKENEEARHCGPSGVIGLGADARSEFGAFDAARLRAPLVLPDMKDAPTRVLDQSIRVRFHAKALEAGAPANVPPLRAMVLVDPKRISAVFTGLGVVVWRIDYTQAGLRESRHPKLDEKVDASRMLRDFMYVLWPAESVRAVLPADAVLAEETSADSRRRTIEVNGKTVLRVVTTKIGERSRTTVVNDLEGYTLSIESVD